MNTKRITGVVASAAICASLGLAATASAGSGLGDVRGHLQQADAALDKADSLAAGGADGRATARLRAANAETRRAAADARRLSAAGKASRAQKMIARQFDQNVDVAVDIVDEVGGGRQVDVAEQIEAAVNGRDRAVTKLTELLDSVAPQAVAGITRAIAGITGSGEAQLEELAELVGSGSIAPQAEEALAAAMAELTESLAKVVAQLESVLAMLPPEAQAHVQAAIGQIEAAFANVTAILGELIAGLPVGGGGFTPPVPVQIPVG